MTELYVLDAAADQEASRLPASLALAAPARRRLEGALRAAGLSIVAVSAERQEAPAPAVAQRLLRAQVTRVVNEADAAERARLESAATTDPADGLDEEFWGSAPDSAAVSRAVYDDLSDQFNERRRLAATSVSRDEAAELLDVAAQSITAKLTAGKLVGFKVGREWRLPAWQFDPDQPSGVRADLDALQAVFPGGPVSLSRWVQRRQPDFDGRTPLEEMTRHGTAPVIELARTLTAAAW